MPTISDRKIAGLVTTFEQEQRTNPNSKVSTTQVLNVLALVADSSRKTAAKMLTELQKPGITMAEQVTLVKAGMTSAEKRDLVTMLDGGTVKFDAGAKALLDAVLGRTTPVDPPPGPRVDGLAITGNQHDGLSGVSKAGAKIEAINISAAPSGRLHMDDTMVVATADANGMFGMAKLGGDQAIKEGDLVRMRARYADGTTSDWLTVKASGVDATDTRNAQVAVFRIGLTAKPNGLVDCVNINESRQVSEPGAKLQFTNKRTGDKTVVTITETGGFPAGFTLKGQAGDAFTLAATDGVNNTAFTTAVGTVNVPGAAPNGTDLIKDPALHKDELNADGTPRFEKKRFTGPLFVDGASMVDAVQGQIGNCYFPAALAAVAKVNPDAVKNMIKANGDGTYTVTFKEQDWSTGRFKDVQIKVDGDLWVRSWGGPLYGRAGNSGDPATMELWYPLVEKAYAAWKGSYDAIGNGGGADDVMEAVLGKNGRSTYISSTGSNSVIWDRIVSSVDNKVPTVAGTFHDETRYANTGVYGDHAYSVIGYEKIGADRYVVVRNPWGESEPAGNGANDGVFKIKFEEFTKLYQNLMYVQ